MAADRDAGVDPRFDPVFQRGYDPSKHGGRRPLAARHAPAESAPAETAPDESGTAESAPGENAPARDAPATVDAGTPAASRVHDPAGAAPTPANADADAPPRGRNPFRLALLLTSIAAMGGGVLLIWNRIEENPYYQGFSGTDIGMLFGAQLREAALVPLLTGGLLGLCLWLAIGVVAPRRHDDG